MYVACVCDYDLNLSGEDVYGLAFVQALPRMNFYDMLTVVHCRSVAQGCAGRT